MIAAAGVGRVLAICADDIGLVEGAAATAVGLGRAGRISAASCVTTTGPLWRREARALGDGNGFELGLHFNLSEGAPASPRLAAHWPTFPGLGKLIVLAHLGRLPLPALADEWQAQVDAFTDALGREPDFVDGHQHVHHLPGVRTIVLDGAARFAVPAAVRSTGRVASDAAGVKARVIEATGGRALARELRRRGLRHNVALLGAYGFGGGYRALVRRWLASAPPAGGLLFCHPCNPGNPGSPGVSGDDRPGRNAPDPIAAARGREAAYLASDDFVADLAAAGVRVGSSWVTA